MKRFILVLAVLSIPTLASASISAQGYTWYAAGDVGPATLSAGGSSLLSENALTVTRNPASTGTGVYDQEYAIANMPTINLVNIGDQVTVSFDFVLSVAAGVNNRWRFGLFNSMATQVTADGQGGDNLKEDKGYWTGLKIGGTIQSTSFRDSGALTGAYDFLLSHDLKFFDGGTATIAGDVKHTMEWTLVKTDVDQIQLYYYLDGAPFRVGTPAYLTGNNIFSFDEIIFANADRIPEFSIDNLNVAFVPEPGTLVILGLGSLSFLRRRK